MTMRYLAAAAAVLFSGTTWAQNAPSPVASADLVVNLRTEYRADPLVLDTTSPRFSWQLASSRRGVSQAAYRILAASSAVGLARNTGDLWDTGKVAGDQSLQLEYAGKALATGQHVFWKVMAWEDATTATAWSQPATFSIGPLKASDWHAKWIGYPNDDANRANEAAPCFRKEVVLNKPIARATMHICGLGQYELTLNGKKVGDSVLSPAWTAYEKTCAYDSYDVTSQLAQGPNAVGIVLGNGMYNVLRIAGRYTKFTGSQGVPKAIAQLVVEYADGTSTTVGTDATWKVARGPVTFTHAYGGEDYDARKEISGWDRPGFADSDWTAAAEVPAPGAGNAQLVSAINPPIKISKVYPSVKVTQTTPGTWVYDFGQNLSGWPHLKVQGPAGTVIRMTPGETLAATGNVSQASSGSPVWFSYTLKGDGVEDWRPKFTYYGFRYLQVQGAAPKDQAAAGSAAIEELSSEFTHADVRPVGTFTSSSETLNRIHTLINMAILSNTQSVLTDCPHREKLGWLEQSHLMADGIAMNYDIATLYTKMCRDMRDSQTATGLIPDIAPEFTTFSAGFRDSPEWGSAAVIDPWYLYQTYGDTRVLRDQYDTMKKYVAYLGTKAKEDIVAHGLGDWYDIGPKGPGAAQLTSLGLTSTATYYYDLDIVRRAAELLHNADDAKLYAAKAAEVRKAFNAKFFMPDTAQYEKGSQTALAMPVALGLVEPEKKDAIVGKLADAVTANQFRVTAGDVGFSYVVKTLTDSGRGDVMLNMMLQNSGPGYVAQLNKGATSLTEAWDALASSSQNHLMLGHAEAWLYRGLAGIQNDPEGGAFKHFVIRPQVAGTLTSAGATYESAYGVIKSSWKRDGKRLTMNVTIPANTTAKVYVPAENGESVLESGKPAKTAVGLTLEKVENGAAVFTAGSGDYMFETTIQNP